MSAQPSDVGSVAILPPKGAGQTRSFTVFHAMLSAGLQWKRLEFESKDEGNVEGMEPVVLCWADERLKLHSDQALDREPPPLDREPQLDREPPPLDRERKWFVLREVSSLIDLVKNTSVTGNEEEDKIFRNIRVLIFNAPHIALRQSQNLAEWILFTSDVDHLNRTTKIAAMTDLEVNMCPSRIIPLVSLCVIKTTRALEQSYLTEFLHGSRQAAGQTAAGQTAAEYTAAEYTAAEHTAAEHTAAGQRGECEIVRALQYSDVIRAMQPGQTLSTLKGYGDIYLLFDKAEQQPIPEGRNLSTPLLSGLASGPVVVRPSEAKSLLRLLSSSKLANAPKQDLANAAKQYDERECDYKRGDHQGTQYCKKIVILTHPITPVPSSTSYSSTEAIYDSPFKSLDQGVPEKCFPIQLRGRNTFFLLYRGTSAPAFMKATWAYHDFWDKKWLNYHHYVNKYHDGMQQYLYRAAQYQADGTNNRETQAAEKKPVVVFIQDLHLFFPEHTQHKYLAHGRNVFLGLLESGLFQRVVASVPCDFEDLMILRYVTHTM
ncbi:hypothetical protein GNI_105700 [Gregarina niphandrodes]|uniref:Uncharacterized protein n=1 Tax=Gregarina niphandrodes TaxID=110365 RepID=A0A023B3Y6_GRENI|nr:hypothetical protein GNI_105700 [Gregarina niphandrodes]EZG56110.1 hypothetical protein GNI_105700 [Gregarina niphandrodes]|eukprot:XP_011131343.1 hypothetical protein GNI_105700 [Gregarina niphandrodes]